MRPNFFDQFDHDEDGLTGELRKLMEQVRQQLDRNSTLHAEVDALRATILKQQREIRALTLLLEAPQEMPCTLIRALSEISTRQTEATDAAGT